MTETLQISQVSSTSPGTSASNADLLTALVQLGLGGVSIGASVVQKPDALLDALSPDRGAQEELSGGTAPAAPSESPSERAFDGAVGVAAATQGLVRKGFARAWGLHTRILDAAATPIRAPMDALGVTDLARGPVDALTSRVQSTFEFLEETGRSEVQRSRLRAGSTLASTIDAIVDYLAHSPAVDDLIELQIDKLVPLLADHPAVAELIQVQVDRILPLLAESAAVQALIQAQVTQILPELSNSPDVQKLIAQAVNEAQALNQPATIAVVDRVAVPRHRVADAALADVLRGLPRGRRRVRREIVEHHPLADRGAARADLVHADAGELELADVDPQRVELRAGRVRQADRRVARHAAEIMPDGGSIMALSYYAAEKVVPRYNVMAVAKAALENIVRYLAADLGPQGIRVNALSPGPIKTLAAAGVPGFRMMLKYSEKVTPLRSQVTQEDVGNVAVFLASDWGRQVTGETVYIDGGYHILGLTMTEEDLES